jgi:hypothetical protein
VPERLEELRLELAQARRVIASLVAHHGRRVAGASFLRNYRM